MASGTASYRFTDIFLGKCRVCGTDLPYIEGNALYDYPRIPYDPFVCSLTCLETYLASLDTGGGETVRLRGRESEGSAATAA